MTQPFPEGSLVLEMIIWLRLGTRIPRISKPQKEGVEVTGSSCNGGDREQELHGRQMQEHILLHAPRSPHNYFFGGDTLWQKLAQNKYGNVGMQLQTVLAKRE